MPTELMTVNDIIKSADRPITRQAIDQRIRSRKLRPAECIGGTRLFTKEQAEKILS